MDKRFWSGAIIGLTIVVAGASALPVLLLRPAVDETPEAVTPFVSKPVASVIAQPPAAPSVALAATEVKPKPAAASQPQPVVTAAVSHLAQPARADVEPAGVQPVIPVITEVKREPAAGRTAARDVAPLAALPRPQSQAVAVTQPASAFPPVQILDGPAHLASVLPPQTRAAGTDRQGNERRNESRREKVTRSAARHDGSPRRGQVRPAPYPIRQFLAWRR